MVKTCDSFPKKFMLLLLANRSFNPQSFKLWDKELNISKISE